jgi:ferrous iron transport protein B
MTTANATKQTSPLAATRCIALIGNPNTGKTTLFNELTGFRRHVANYPGVTVDIARGRLRGAETPTDIIDLPGTYSLAATSPDELVVVNMLGGQIKGQPPPDMIIAIVDASNLNRNLYLVSQLIEMGRPLMIAVNMIDVARSRGVEIDCERLTKKLGLPVIPIQATKPQTLTPLRAALAHLVDGNDAVPSPSALPADVTDEARKLQPGRPLGENIRILMDRDGAAEAQYRRLGGSPETLHAARQRLVQLGMRPIDEIRVRYAWINELLSDVIRRPSTPVKTWSDRLDRILTHRVGGMAVLIVVLLVVFQAIFRWAEPLMLLIENALAALAGWVANALPQGALSSFICDGLIAGIGGVLVFLPQIVILFALIAILEDCGYMARGAYMMDRVMRWCGMSGRSFIPLLSSFACAVPAIMGTRTIADRRERIVTILIAPFMSCSARLPVYILLIGTFIPRKAWLGGWLELPGLVMLAMYALGIVVALPLAWLLKKRVFYGASPTFVIELPSYKWPRWRSVWNRMSGAGREFLARAGSIILAVNVVVWALGYFPHSARIEQQVRATAAAQGWNEAELAGEINGAYLRDSYLARFGHSIEPAIRPLGWDWRIGAAVIASFPAREVVVSTLGTIFNLGDADETSVDLRDALRTATWEGSGKPVFTIPVAISIMVFFALCAQCVSTLVVMGRELRSWMWPVISFVMMTSIAYAVALATALIGRALG